MNFKMLHYNHNVTDLDASIAFYQQALGLHEVRRMAAPDGSFSIVFLQGEENNFELELTWVKEHTEKYDLGEGEFHVAFGCAPEEYDAMHELHKQMGCICFENTEMGLYFIEDPDGLWLEILPNR